jgi:hypothetical protein
MATPTNTQATYNAVGNREDLADIIYNISPTKTPFLSGVAHVEATATNHEWQTDSLAAAANNAAIEGEDVTATLATPSVRLGNYTQISRKAPAVSRTQRKVNSAGRGDDLDYQIMKMGDELKRDMEKVLLDNKAKVAGSTSVARELAGVPAWLATNTNFGATGADPTGDGSDARTDGTQRAFDISFLNDVIAKCAEEGGEPDTIMTGAFNKQALSAIINNGTGGVAQRVVTATDKVVSGSVDVYLSDFGTLNIVYNRFMRPRDMLVLEMDKWAVAFIDNMLEVPLAKNGDSDRVLLLSEYTLEARNEKASGIVADLTTA